MTNTLFLDMPEEQYFAFPAASNSTLGRMAKSAAHCRAYMDNPPEQTPAMAFGSLVHTMILEPHERANRYAVKPEGIDRRTKAGKAAYAEFETESAGKTIVTQFDMERAYKIMSSVKEHRTANLFLTGDGNAEASIFWTDEDTGYRCKSRIDFMRDNRVLVDVKTTQDASPAGFARAVSNYGYHRQAAMYSDGYEAVTGHRAEGFVFIAIETAPPYAVAVYELNPESIQVGREEYKRYLRDFARCMETEIWQGYSDDIEELSLPGWKLAEHENNIIEDIV